MVSLLALGHSITLFTATVAGWRVDPVLVDIAVALSLVFVGAVGISGKRVNWTGFGSIVFAFGLVHGVGLSTRLQELGLPSDGVVPRVLAFNLGVELGQLSALIVLVAAVQTLVRFVPRARRPELSYAVVATAGVVAAALLSVTAFTQPASKAEAVGANCEIRDRTDLYPGGGGHPPKTSTSRASNPRRSRSGTSSGTAT